MGLFSVTKQNAYLRKENQMLRDLCKRKDACFKELMADGLRHGSRLAAAHMAERKSYLRGK